MKIKLINTISNKFLHRDQISLATDILYEYIKTLDIPNLELELLCMYKQYKSNLSFFSDIKNQPLKAFKKTYTELITSIQESNSDIVLISVEYGAARYVKHMIEKLNKILPDTLFVVGGLPVSYLYDEILKCLKNTIAVIGEGEFAIKQIIEKYTSIKLTNLLEYADIPNVIVYDISLKNFKYSIPERIDISNVFIYPYVKPIIHPHKHYYYDVEWSRGCPYGKCSFCAVGYQFSGYNTDYHVSPKWIGFDASNVINKMKYLISNGVTEFAITDSDFIGNNSIKNIQRIIDICAELIKIKIDFGHEITIHHASISVPVIFSYTDGAKLISLKTEMFDMLKQIGLRGFYLGIESGDETQLKIYNKNVVDSNQAKLAKMVLDANGFDLNEYGFMFFDYFSTLNTMLNNIKFIDDIKLWDSCTRIINSLKVFKGTRYYNLMKYAGLLRNKSKGHVFEYDCDYIDSDVRFVVNKSKLFSDNAIPIQRLLKRKDRISMYHQDFLFLKSIINMVKEKNYYVDYMITDHIENRRIFLKSIINNNEYKDDSRLSYYINNY